MGYKIGIDVGGTFTDFILAAPGQPIHLDKCPTTPEDQSLGVMAGLQRLAAHTGQDLPAFLGQADLILHGTTTADNTLIEMKGAVTGLITTDGFRDEIELRRGYKEDIWDPSYPPPQPIVPRRRRQTVKERLDAQGQVVTPLDEASVRQAARRLKQFGVESIGVMLLFSFINPAHERRIAAILAEECPGVDVSLSHEVMPKSPEFERTSTTAVDAYVGPRVRRYLQCLQERLRVDGFAGNLLVMQCNGGGAAAEYVGRRAITCLSSGPVAGVMGTAQLARAVDTPKFISVDMGGTSYDVCMVRGGQPTISTAWNWHHRYLVGIPMVDVRTVGAGGGSIASVRAGRLQVGPESAGAVPGPICYGQSGTQPTVTDANLVLGLLNPEQISGGDLKLQWQGVREAMLEQVGHPLGLATAEEAAYAIFRLVNANMANAIRQVTARQGIDPRDFTLVVFGGNGPVHGALQARDLGMRKVLVPRTAPAFCALGLIMADCKVDLERSYIRPGGEADPAVMAGYWDELERQARRDIAAAGVAPEAVSVQRHVYMRYPGQNWDLSVPVAAGNGFDAAAVRQAAADFHNQHEMARSYALRDQEPVVTGVRLIAAGTAQKPALPAAGAARQGGLAPSGKRRAYMDGQWREVPIYRGDQVTAGDRLTGPCIMEERFTTVVLYPGMTGEVDTYGNYVIAVN